MRIGLASFNSSLIAYIEATRPDIASKNELCPPNRQPDTPGDWIRGTLIAVQADHRWAQEADIAHWMDGARVNIAAGLRGRLADPDVAGSITRYVTNFGSCHSQPRSTYCRSGLRVRKSTGSCRRRRAIPGPTDLFESECGMSTLSTIGSQAEGPG